MGNISKEYLFLFNTITNTEQALEQLRQQLIAAQQYTEDLFLEESDALAPADI